jgi:hypothetical protein
MNYLTSSKLVRPSKILLYKILYSDIKNNFDFKNSHFCDLACGHAQLLKDFKFSRYVGVDLDLNQININKKNHPNCLFVHKDISKYTAKNKFDFITIIECIGINKDFNIDVINDLFLNIRLNIKKRGNVCFNIRRDLYDKNKILLNNFFLEFYEITITNYGYFYKKKFFLFAKILFLTEFVISRFFNIKGKYIYFFCKNFKN